MLDLDALTQLDEALSQSERPTAQHIAKAKPVKAPAPACPHLARIAAE